MSRAVVAAVVAKLVDGVVTVAGVTTGRAVERNPIAAAAFDALGLVPGVVVVTLVALAVAVGGVESAAGRLQPPRARLVRAAAYGTLAVVWTVVAVYNTVLLADSLV